ncbi:hypothetical protein ACJRO7_017110 [Eucalyptus globulus]|uniref:DUF4220 domain-containing protein n=1 Tax=Eucalyptus globulus TaxID=34317 RepID=A0ABD3KVK9_EUCGL
MVGLVNKFVQKLWERCDGMSDQEIDHQLAKIDALLAITAAISVFLGVSGSFRRCCGNRAFVMVAFAAYTLRPAVTVYTLGLIQTAQFCSVRLPIWATYLVVFLGNVDSYTAHSMGDIERWKSFKVDSAAKFILTSWMISQALKLASNSMMQKNDRYIADYMSTEHQWRDSSDEDPATVRGYRYLVRGAEEAKVHSLCSTAKWRRKVAPWRDGDAPHYRQLLEVTDEVITVEKVWNCKDPDGRLKDVCLSFSLFKFIRLRFSGYSLPQEAHKKLWRLIQHILSEENGYERVFRVIEVELPFLFDLFYTKYPVNLHWRRLVYRLLLLPIVVALPALLIYSAIWNKYVLGVVVTASLMMSILVVKLTQFGIMIFSEWAKVTYICNYVRNEGWQRNKCAGKLIEIIQLRRYSLLKSYSYSPPKWIYNRLTAAYLDQKRNGQKQIASTNLSKQVKKAIARSLGFLEKGQASLRRNNLSDELSWACDLETTTHVIMYELPCAQLSQEHRENFGIATKLSQYLAYLVVFAPKLLPGHPCRTEYIFSRAVSEAREKLGASSVLADFWVDMMLYVAPSNDTVAHAKYLTTGGEVVTHIWVLVSHAGITRDPRGGE